MTTELVTASSMPQQEELEDLYTVHSNNFTAVAEDFALDRHTENLWMISMVGPQTSVKAIWARLNSQGSKQVVLAPGGADGMISNMNAENVLTGSLPHHTAGQRRARIARLPRSGAWHLLLYTRLSEPDYGTRGSEFIMLLEEEEDPATAHWQFMKYRSSVPIHPDWKDWLWQWALENETARQIESVRRKAFYCTSQQDKLREAVSQAVRDGTLNIPRETGEVI